MQARRELRRRRPDLQRPVIVRVDERDPPTQIGLRVDLPTISERRGYGPIAGLDGPTAEDIAVETRAEVQGVARSEGQSAAAVDIEKVVLSTHRQEIASREEHLRRNVR